MGDSPISLLKFPNQKPSRSTFFFIPTTLALISSFVILLYISETSKLFPIGQVEYNITLKSLIQSLPISTITQLTISVPLQNDSKKLFFSSPETGKLTEVKQPSQQLQSGSNGNYMNSNEVFHDRDIFLEDYKWMNRSFRIFVYPHERNDPFANVLLPVDYEPGGNYASEGYFKKSLMKSHFITKDPTKADLFFLPFSISKLRYDPRIIGLEGIQDFIRDYVVNISRKYPYWNRTDGADHFYVACHSIGRSAMEKAIEVKRNAIQVVCTSNYFLSGYMAHKDASLPQIWPRQTDPPNLVSSKRKKLAFFAGSINSPVCEKLLQFWRNDSEIDAHSGRLTTPYADELLGSKFCLHVKGFEVNTARIADSLNYGCVPVIIANHYDLPFADILDWRSFSVVVATSDIPLLKKILKEISSDRYLLLQHNALKVRKHFQWHPSPVDYDAFYMVMYELWLRRSTMRLQLSPSIDSS